MNLHEKQRNLFGFNIYWQKCSCVLWFFWNWIYSYRSIKQSHKEVYSEIVQQEKNKTRLFTKTQRCDMSINSRLYAKQIIGQLEAFFRQVLFEFSHSKEKNYWHKHVGMKTQNNVSDQISLKLLRWGRKESMNILQNIISIKLTRIEETAPVQPTVMCMFSQLSKIMK